MDIGKPYGLALCGGKSSRMGTDKSLLFYHGKAQCYHVYEMLQNFCSETFISCNSSQTAGFDKSYHVLEDNVFYAGAGPISGLMTAFAKFPGKDILVAGCDYPFLNMGEMTNFLSKISQGSLAAAFYDDNANCYQPVLAWYAAAAAALLNENFQRGVYSLQQFLQKINAVKYHPLDRLTMTGADTEESRILITRHLFNTNSVQTSKA